MPSSESDHQRKGGFVGVRAGVRIISQLGFHVTPCGTRGASRPLLRMQPIRLNPIYQASAERLFDAWTKPDQMRLGLFESPTNKIVRIDQTHSWGSVLHRRKGGWAGN